MTFSCFAMLYYCSATLVLPVDLGPEGTTSVPTPASELSVHIENVVSLHSMFYWSLCCLTLWLMATLLEAIPGC